MMKFNLGEQVSFEPPGRGVIIGILTRFNKKSVTVITEAGQKWTVAPNLLLKISDVKTKANEAETKLIGK